MSTVTLTNREGESVEIPEDLANQYFNTLQIPDQLLSAAGHAGDAEDVDSDDGDELAPSTNLTTAPPAGALATGGPSAAGGAKPDGVKMGMLPCCKATLEVIRDYVATPESTRTTAAIPRPLKWTLQAIATSEDMKRLDQWAKDKLITEVLEVALHLRYAALSDLCAAYMYERIIEISQKGPTIMQAAENIRQFMNVPNEWTPEEMVNLEKTMTYANWV